MNGAVSEVAWMYSLDDADWDRTVVIIDRLLLPGSTARMPLSKASAMACSN
jgi:hypothetical protein